MVFANVSTVLFAPESPRPWALMRIVLACTLLVDAGARWPYCVELYSSAGFTFPAFPDDAFHPFALAPLATIILHSLLIVLLVFLLVGWYSRLCAVTSFLLLGWFSLLDASGTLTKYTAIALHVLLLMSFAQPGGVWSIDAWRRKKNGDAVPLAPAWPRHLLCLLVASIYLGAAITKIRLPDFATGDLLEFSLLDDAYGGRYPGFWLATQPKRLVLASYAVILFELLFPFLIWVPTLRRGLLVAGFVFHTALAAMMHLAMFSPVMIAALFAFMRESDLRFLSPRKGNRSKKARSLGGNPSSAKWIEITAFAAAVSTFTASLAGFQYWQDAYGVFHREREIVFDKIEANAAYEMIDAFEPDARFFFHRIDIGSQLGYRRVYGKKEVFQSGDIVYVIARLLPPHPSWDARWELIPPPSRHDENAPTAVYDRQLDSSHSYASIGFLMQPDFPRGEYRIRLSVGEPFGPREFVTEIPFTLE